MLGTSFPAVRGKVLPFAELSHFLQVNHKKSLACDPEREENPQARVP